MTLSYNVNHIKVTGLIATPNSVVSFFDQRSSEQVVWSRIHDQEGPITPLGVAEGISGSLIAFRSLFATTPNALATLIMHRLTGEKTGILRGSVAFINFSEDRTQQQLLHPRFLLEVADMRDDLRFFKQAHGIAGAFSEEQIRSLTRGNPLPGYIQHNQFNAGSTFDLLAG